MRVQRELEQRARSLGFESLWPLKSPRMTTYYQPPACYTAAARTLKSTAATECVSAPTEMKFTPASA
jgi:hypothetical protein